MAWTITQTIHTRVSIKPADGSKAMVVKLACISDASASGEFDLKADNSEIFSHIRGSILKFVKFVPGTSGDVPDAAFDFDVEDDTNFHILDTDSNSHTAASYVLGLSTLGEYPRIYDDLSVVIGTLGDANTTDIYLHFER